MSYITQTKFDSFVTLPVTLPQTELRTQRYIQVASFPLLQGQHLEMRSLCLHLLRILTPGVTPVTNNTSLGLASVGMLVSTMISSAFGIVSINAAGVASLNSDQPVIVTAPGNYKIMVFNNSTNVDMAVVVTGSVKIFT